MKMYLTLNSSGKIIGTARESQKGEKGFDPNMKLVVKPRPGQTVHEVEVPDEIAKLSGDELFKKLVGIDEVKKIIKT